MAPVYMNNLSFKFAEALLKTSYNILTVKVYMRDWPYSHCLRLGERNDNQSSIAG